MQQPSMFGCPPMMMEVFNKRYKSQKSLHTIQLLIFKNYGFLLSLIKIQIDKGDFIHSKYLLHIIRRKCQLSCPDMRHVKMGRKSREKNSWARECIFSSHRPQKSMKNKRINIKEEKFRILLENWSRYRSEEISP